MKRLLGILLMCSIPLLARPQEGTVDHCDNAASTEPAHRCECEHTNCPPGQAMSSKCKTFCREDHCHCASSCAT